MMPDTKLSAPVTEPEYDPSRPIPKTELLYMHPIQIAPGKTIISTRVICKPNAATPPHTHPGAFITAYVDKGHVLNKMNDEPMQVHGPGDTFKEMLGCHHKICENLSKTEEAVFYVTMVVDTEFLEKVGLWGLFLVDEEYRDVAAKAMSNA